ncbi:hypothetical protein C8Q73DRAFT_160931 [Cubamyces lactineus]|nr:hypothetical protein C8Q73DRAFT_160931 [Cubamyces lactineus]
MDHKALSKLTYNELQKLAKREGIRANQKKALIVSELVRKYHPMLVPVSTAASTRMSSRSQVTTRSVSALLKTHVKDKEPEIPVQGVLRRVTSYEDTQEPNQSHKSPNATPHSLDDSHLSDAPSSPSSPWSNGNKRSPLPNFTLRPATWSPVLRNRTQGERSNGTGCPAVYINKHRPSVHDTYTPSNHSAPSQCISTPLANEQRARVHEQDVHAITIEDVASAGGPHRPRVSAKKSDIPRRDTSGTVTQTLKELQQALNLVTPLANEETETREQVREIQLLVSSIGRRTAALREKARRLHQLRLALERHLPELRPPQAGPAAPRTEEGPGSEGEEEESIEVEEMTSRKVDSSDLPSTPGSGDETEGPGLKRKRLTEDASPDGSPRKRARAVSSV